MSDQPLSVLPDIHGRHALRDAAAIPQIARGLVWCRECGREQKVDGTACLRYGWPKCCGYTMTIDSPEERRAGRAS